MNTFSPEDLKKQYPAKYDKWEFARNGKGEWVGYCEARKGE